MSLDHARLVRSAEQRLRRQLERGRARTAEPATPPTTIETVPARNVQGDGLARVEAWFARQGMQPFAFQRDTWAHYRAGASGLIHASTGTGKTLAAWLGPVMETIDEEACNVRHPGFEHSSAGSIATSRIAAPRDDISRRHCEKSPVRRRSNPGASEKRASESALQVLWITPMRALAADTLRALAAPLSDLGLSWRVGLRTGDTSQADRARQDRKRLQAMVTTPESLSLMLTRAEQATTFGSLRAVIVDEWHELMSSKRGVQVELALARLKRLAPRVRIWGLSATLRQSRSSARYAAGDRLQWSARVRLGAEVARDRRLAAARHSSLPMGGSSRHARCRASCR
jgi:ATP-dependent Lhr-like helicase